MIDIPQVVQHSAVATSTDTQNEILELPVLVILPHNRCNCRCLMCDIWKIRQIREITAADLQPHLDSLRQLKVRWIVLSGGEPLLHSCLPDLCKPIRAEGIRLTILTSGLLLEQKAKMIAENCDEVIVSLDGPAIVHNRIRGVLRAFERMSKGLCALRVANPCISVQGRCTIQKENCTALRDTVRAAKDLALDSISFLAADVTSEAFNRPGGWPPDRQWAISLIEEDVEKLDREIESVITDYSREILEGFIAENPEKLRSIVLHFRALLGQVQPTAPVCNAPWVSAVIDSEGAVLPCFFHPPIGNIQEKPLARVLNERQAMEFRAQLDIPNNPVCRRCVCSLYIPRRKPP